MTTNPRRSGTLAWADTLADFAGAPRGDMAITPDGVTYRGLNADQLGILLAAFPDAVAHITDRLHAVSVPGPGGLVTFR